MSNNLSKRELLRRKREEQKRKKTKTFVLITLAALFLLSLLIFLPNILNQPAADANTRGIPLGDPKAPVSVVNFSSFTCGHCADFSSTIEPEFIANYVETGKVKYFYINVAGSNLAAQTASKASYCAADQDRFFDYKSYLYSAAYNPDGFSTENLISLASNAGLDTDSFATCLESNKYVNAPNEDQKFAQSVGVTGTPSFLVNGQLVYSNELIPLVDSLLNN